MSDPALNNPGMSVTPRASRFARLTSPASVLALSGWLLPWLTGLALILGGLGLYLGLVVAPPDYQQGETVRIMFVHVPAASLALGIYLVMSAAALGVLVWRHPMAEVALKAATPIGAAYALICLATGSLWGRPMWGTWWEWDARLTSMLVLFLTYLGLMALWRTIEEPAEAARAAAVTTLVGAVNWPIVKFSVEWFHTLHQGPSLLRAGGPTIHPDILVPLFVMGAAYAAAFAAMHLAGMRNEVLRRRARALSLLAAQRPDQGAAHAAGVLPSGAAA